MKVKASELSHSALNWMVASIEFPKGNYGGEADHYSGNRNERWVRIPDKKNRQYVLAEYSSNWAQAGEIIEREGISLKKSSVAPDGCKWTAFSDSLDVVTHGSTAVIAAMRCFVMSKLGAEVDVPEEFLVDKSKPEFYESSGISSSRMRPN